MWLFQNAYKDSLTLGEAKQLSTGTAGKELDRAKKWMSDIVEREVAAKTPGQKKSKQDLLASISSANDFRGAQNALYSHGSFIVGPNLEGKETFEKLDAVLNICRPMPSTGLNVDWQAVSEEEARRKFEEKSILHYVISKTNPYNWFLDYMRKQEKKPE